jgi:crotonobetainyl-CoA:carnitine CoA-transferase CaiB-like acyl-CoA transferase
MPAARLANRSELEVLINDALGTRTVAEWVAAFDAAGVPAGPVQDIGQALEHEQTRAVGMVIDADAPGGKTTRALGLPVILDGQATPATGVPPRVGENTRAVLLECGFTSAEVDALIEKGAVFQAA